MIRRVSLGAGLTLIALSFPAEAAAGTIDQQQPSAQAATSNETVFGGQRQAAQTFTAGLTGGLDQVDVYVGGRPLACEPGSGIKVEVRTVTGEAPSDSSLATATIPPSSVPGQPSWAPVTFATPAPVTAGTRYALVLSAFDATCPLNPGEDPYLWTGATGNPYAAGSAWLKDPELGPGWIANGTDFDEAFRTFVVPQSAPTAVDTDPPETTITKEPTNRSNRNRARYKFISDEPNSTFECKIDKKPFKACNSPKRFRVKEGKHQFLVRAIDAAGNADPTADKDKFKVVA